VKRLLKREKEYFIKKREPKKLDEEFIFIRSEKTAKRKGLTHLLENDELDGEEIEDETLP
jgi:hypothetical protein